MVANASGKARKIKPDRRSFTIDEYERMIEAGILCEDEHVELLAGAIVKMAALGSRHAKRLDRQVRRFARSLPDDAILRVQEPIRLPPDFEPEPDPAIVRFRADEYEDAHPNPDDVLLVVEIADTSLHTDRDIKIPRYAAAGNPEAWLWDLLHNQLIVCREAKDGVYTSVTRLRRGSSIAPLAFPDLTVAVSEILK